MFFKKSKHKDNVKQVTTAPLSPSNEKFFSTQGIRFGESILTEDFIQCASKRMTERCSEDIEKCIHDARDNNLFYGIEYYINQAMIYDRRERTYVYFSKYDIAPLKDDEYHKKEGIAWALQELVVPQLLQKHPEIIEHNISVKKIISGYASTECQCNLYFKIHLNRFRSL